MLWSFRNIILGYKNLRKEKASNSWEIDSFSADGVISFKSKVVLLYGKFGEEFQIKRGLRRGDPLSNELFNWALEMIMRDSWINGDAV